MFQTVEIKGASRPRVRSFDIFDTLISRIVSDPTDVFDLVEKTGVEDFKARRLLAQSRSNHTWADIYKHYKDISGLDDLEIYRIQRIEIDTEIAVSYLVSKTYTQVRDGDILVSDMYLPPAVIVEILRACGFSKTARLFVSPGGKATGQIWGLIRQDYDIEYHIGDNQHSDFESPRLNQIPSIHFSDSRFSYMEQLLRGVGAQTTANILRRFRLTNPFAPESQHWKLYEIQADCNLPFLLFMAGHLNDIMNTESLTRILFTTRDCCLIQPIFEALYPEKETIQFHSSRIAYEEARPTYAAYIKTVYAPGQTLIFDLHGMFKTGRSLFQELYGATPRVHIFSGADGRAPAHPSITVDVSQGSNLCEVLNLDSVGPLITVDESGDAVRAPLIDYDIEISRAYRAAAAIFKSIVQSNAASIRAELSAVVGCISWGEIHNYICDTVSAEPELLKVPLGQEPQSLTKIMNDNNSDKGNSYKCAHCYSYVYENILQAVGHQNRFALLEIGLNRDAEVDIPSLRGWRKYFGPKVSLYGMDINPEFTKFDDPDQDIRIVIGDQANPSDLLKCAIVNPHGYDVIIDDGFHASRHQQITLKELWSSLKPGGLFIIEDLHYQPISEDVINTRDMLIEWKKGNLVTTQHLGTADARRIINEAVTIELYDSRSTLWPLDSVRNALAVIRKRR